MSGAPGTLRIGTCSWKYPSWSGLVYSRPTGIDYLAEYARRYSTVEVDQWFWSLFAGGKVRLPDARDVEAYRAAVDGRFRFTVKAPNSLTLTHTYSREKGRLGDPNPGFLSPDLVAGVHRFAGTSARRPGPGHPPVRVPQPREDAVGEGPHGAAGGLPARRCPNPSSTRVEIRNPNYLGGTFLDFLLEHRFARSSCRATGCRRCTR